MTGRGHECGCKLLSDCREVDAMFGSENNANLSSDTRKIYFHKEAKTFFVEKQLKRDVAETTKKSYCLVYQ